MVIEFRWLAESFGKFASGEDVFRAYVFLILEIVTGGFVQAGRNAPSCADSVVRELSESIAGQLIVGPPLDSPNRIVEVVAYFVCERASMLTKSTGFGSVEMVCPMWSALGVAPTAAGTRAYALGVKIPHQSHR